MMLRGTVGYTTCSVRGPVLHAVFLYMTYSRYIRIWHAGGHVNYILFPNLRKLIFLTQFVTPVRQVVNIENDVAEINRSRRC